MQDWLDIDFAISEAVDFIAVSFVKGPDVINNLKSYLVSRAGSGIEVIAKVESYDSVPNLPEIVAASDAVMVARGDLGKLLACPASCPSSWHCLPRGSPRGDTTPKLPDRQCILCSQGSGFRFSSRSLPLSALYRKWEIGSPHAVIAV